MRSVLQSAGATSMKPSKLKAHLASSHPTHQNDSEDVFRSKKARFMAKGTLTRHGFQPSTKPILEASYEVALLIAKEKGSYDWRNDCKALRRGDGELGLQTRGGQETQECSPVQQHHQAQN